MQVREAGKLLDREIHTAIFEHIKTITQHGSQVCSCFHNVDGFGIGIMKVGAVGKVR